MNEFDSTQTASLFAGTTEQQTGELNALFAGDIRQPWRSVYGFPMAAAQLAANQLLLLHCREDEVFDLLASLNSLLAQPQVLNQAQKLLERLRNQTRQKLLQRLELEQQPISESEEFKLIAALEQVLAQPTLQTTSSRLEAILSASMVGQETAGLKTMLARLQMLIPALAAVKVQGFHVVAQDRHRLSARPALESRRAEPIWLDDRPTAISAGFLLPAKYHLTLWSYRIVRSDQGQSTVWN